MGHRVRFRDIAYVRFRNSPPLWLSSPVLQLVSEPVWSPVDFNMLCDPEATWRNVLLSLWSSMARISVTGKSNLQLSSETRSRHLGDRTRGVCDPGYTRPRDPR
jgi:hypothetical protein